MKSLRNNLQLLGNVGNDPEIKTLDSGKKMATFTIATNETYKDSNGEKVQETQWHKVIAWGKLAEIVEKYVTKGKEIAIGGRITYRSYDDKNGEKRYITEIVISELLLLSK